MRSRKTLLTNEGLLHYVLGALEIANFSQRRTEGEMLETSRQIHEGGLVAFNRPAHEMFVVHCHVPFTSRCLV
jgi:hypothetical protein